MIEAWYNIHDLVKVHLCVGESNSARVIDPLLAFFRVEPIDPSQVSLEFRDPMKPPDFSDALRLGFLNYSPSNSEIWDKRNLLKVGPEGKISVYSNDGVDEYVLTLLLMIQLVRRGLALCHALGIVSEGKAIVFPAWHNTGKTGLFAYMLDRERTGLLGDDQVILSKHGITYSLPYPVKIESYHVSKGAPEVSRVVKRKRNISVSKILGFLYGKFASRGISILSAISPRLVQIVYRLFPKRYVALTVKELVSDDRMPSQAPLGTVISLTRYSGDSLKIELCTPNEVVAEMISMLYCSELFSPSVQRFIQYWQSMAAFGAIESWQQLLSSLEQVLTEALKDANCYRLSIPEDVGFTELGEFLSGVVGQ
ncbi:MAG: hypothetical protein JSV77_00060 [Dehalococcoidales bacterium]|nr:MAG: hypothetical protein JSV77_00060 [Dehalococcoidales bacterium]